MQKALSEADTPAPLSYGFLIVRAKRMVTYETQPRSDPAMPSAAGGIPLYEPAKPSA